MSSFVIFTCLSLIGCGKNQNNTVTTENTSKNTAIKEKSNSKTNVEVETVEKTEEKKFIEYMEQDEYANPKKKNGELSSPYTFYDINGDGIEELIIAGDYINFQIYSYVNDEVILVGHNKYGGSLCFYPEFGVFYWTGGHKNYYYEEYNKLTSTTSKIIATKEWMIKPPSNKEKNVKYTISGKASSKKKYTSKIKKIKSSTKVKADDLKWENLGEDGLDYILD